MHTRPTLQYNYILAQSHMHMDVKSSRSTYGRLMQSAPGTLYLHCWSRLSHMHAAAMSHISIGAIHVCSAARTFSVIVIIKLRVCHCSNKDLGRNIDHGLFIQWSGVQAVRGGNVSHHQGGLPRRFPKLEKAGKPSRTIWGLFYSIFRWDWRRISWFTSDVP